MPKQLAGMVFKGASGQLEGITRCRLIRRISLHKYLNFVRAYGNLVQADFRRQQVVRRQD